MIDFFASITVSLIIVMTLVILYSNHCQARALNEMKRAVQGWVESQMRDRRETRRRQTRIDNPKKWFSEQAGLVISGIQRRLEAPPALEFLAEEGKRLVVSPLPPSRLKDELKSIESKQKKLKNLVEPLLGKDRRKVKVLEKSSANAGEWFDLEAEAAVKALQVQWNSYSKLWFYVISPRNTGKEPFIRMDLSSQWEWLQQRKDKVTAWFKTQISKSSS